MGNEIVVNKESCFIVLSIVFLIMFMVSQLRYHANKHKIRRKRRRY